MLDYFVIFQKGGALLWSWQLTALRGSPIEVLIRTCLLEERSGEKSFTYKPPVGSAYTLKWSLHNKLGLVFVAVYQSALKLAYVERLLERVKHLFEEEYTPNKFDYALFEATFRKELEKAEKATEIRPKAINPANGNLIHRKVPGRSTGNAGGDSSTQHTSSEDGEEDESELSSTPDSLNASSSDISKMNVQKPAKLQVKIGGVSDERETSAEEDGDDAFDVSKIKGKLAKRPPKGVGAAKKEKDAKAKKGKDSKKKVPRKWGAAGSDKEDEVLDFSQENGRGPVENLAADLSKASLVDADEEEDSDLDDEVGPDAQNKGSAKPAGFLSAFVTNIRKNVMGTEALTRADVQPALDQLRRKLMERNVAEEISGKVCESVASNLVGEKLDSFTRISSAVRQAVEAALTRILTPKRSIDILRQVHASKAKGQPYTIVFVGVNGVGKSTNLSKVAYWLIQNGMKVMIAACDTFRSGAVEQLKTHCNRLNIPLYERGYEKDPAKVAFEARQHAARNGIDVLLVDTAGRMQDNEPLMRALSNLISLNDPELVLFVGEALVGNDAVDQLTKFNQRLLDLSTSSKPHAIDGILLTKFDTIDDKVGAALSMVYTSGAPVMFVGCGQTYVDLKRLNVKSIVNSLLK